MKKQSLLILTCLLSLASMAQLPKTSFGTIKKHFIKSKFVEGRDIDVWLPPNYSPGKQYAVLYMQDGQNLFDTTYTYNHEEWKVDEQMQLLLKNDQIRETIVVGIYNTDDRWLEFVPAKPFNSLPPAWQDSVFWNMRMKKSALKSDNYLRFIVKEVKPFIDSVYSTYRDPFNTFIMGGSIGGLISFYAVCEYPQVFGGAACLSTHWPGGQMTDRKDNKLYAEYTLKYLKTKTPSPQNHRFYFDYGTESLDKFYEPYQKKIDEALKAKGYDSRSLLTLKFGAGDHSEKSWAKRLAGPLFFLLRK